ncbi:sulfotransferase 1C2A-like [Lytechinus variegatus]|uniref:sulfotransferase 1C2A-like n=1 Tax=Lytechinus variegatus TaxID=7654 RepID=UPI001BB0EFDD|nr:sulfotransferase 1C2A-like [Lytechinus variegatus]
MIVSEKEYAVECWTGEMSALLAKSPAHAAKLCHEYENVVMVYYIPKKGIEQTKRFKVRPDDVYIISYPKVGTTWLQQIAMLVRLEGDLSFFEGKHIITMVPFLEICTLPDMTAYKDKEEIMSGPTGVEMADAMPTNTPRILKTHVVPRWLPDGLKDNPPAKVLYMARNPKDTAVSGYHFCQLVKPLPTYTWHEFFEEFIADRAFYGSWFEHTLYWWKLRNHPNVLFLKYEDMKQDPRKAVIQIAEFMGKSLPNDIIDRIVEASSFKFMKSNESMNPDVAFNKLVDLTKEKSFMRKGMVGDWKNYFTEDQNHRFDKLYEEKMSGSGLEFGFE